MPPLVVVSSALIGAGLAFAFIGFINLIVGRHLPWFIAAGACFGVGTYGLAS